MLHLKSLNPTTNAWAATVGAAALLLVSGGVVAMQLSQRQAAQELAAVALQPVEMTQVSAMGRIEPQGDIIQLSAPTASGLSTPTVSQRLKQWLVAAGDEVSANQKIAVMHGLEKAQSAVDNAAAQVEVARARLAQVRAGNAPGQIAAQREQVAQLQAQLEGDLRVQRLTITSLQTELAQAELDYQRFLDLYSGGSVSRSQMEQKRLQRDLVQQQLQQAQATLARIQTTGAEQIQSAQATLSSLADVRPADVQVAEAELTNAMTMLRQAEVDLDALYVRSPIDGQMLVLNTQPGENVGVEGLATLGQTQHMYVVAEVYESDARYLQLGQSAKITSESAGFTGTLTGQVEQIGLTVEKPGLVNNAPTAQSDVRVVQVKIRLSPADSDRVRTFNQMQVWVAIEL